MIMFNLRMTFESNEDIPLKIQKIIEQPGKYLTEKQLTLNSDKNRCYSLQQIILICIQSLLLTVKLLNQIMLVVILEYKLIQS